ncbi:MAG: sucrose phosphorylase [Bacteroidetes bacterium HLUCCA01]|nr:MAG: sucrose phosphorylase [Bacteroidetes bacterium HLUCCA01]
MTVPNITNIMLQLHSRFEYLYGSQADACMKRFQMMIGRYGIDTSYQSTFQVLADGTQPARGWSSADSILITYGDSIVQEGEAPLETLRSFMMQRVGKTITGIHILPFFPYTSDDGFSVQNYHEVREDLGGWMHIRRLAREYRVMGDVVINHVSAQSNWFRDFKKGIAPARDYFHVTEPSPALDQVTRPRNLPLLTPVKTPMGPVHVWTTFSPDQIDLNFANPDVLFEFLDIILLYISQGVSVLRLDAIAYLWKRVGTNCIHLPETHEVVKLIRNVLDLLAPHVTIITETNVPHAENVSYFGTGDEAHMVYQFSLPPLLLHALLRGNARWLTQWAAGLQPAPDGCAYFNFTSSHDGVGVRPLEGLVPTEEFEYLVNAVLRRNGRVSNKKNPDGSESPYELNITYYDALACEGGTDDGHQTDRFLCSQAIMLSLQGVPGIYIHALTGSKNDLEGLACKGYNRAINRKQWQRRHLEHALDDENTSTGQVFDRYLHLLKIRSAQPAFDPAAEQKVLDLGDALFAHIRSSEEGTLLCLFNVTDARVDVHVHAALPEAHRKEAYRDVISGDIRGRDGHVTLAPYDVVWLKV